MIYRHEKAVAEQLHLRSVETFLPIYHEIRYWKQRKAKVEAPLFPGYVFVRIALREKLRVLQVPGIVCLVSYNGAPAAVPESEMEALQTVLALRKAEPHPYLSAGQRVRIKAGPLRGLEGLIVRRKSDTRLIVSVDFIQRSASVELQPLDLESLCS